MTYAEAERYLLSLELFGMRFGLDRMRRLMTVLGSPQERYGTIHRELVLRPDAVIRKARLSRSPATVLPSRKFRCGEDRSPTALTS